MKDKEIWKQVEIDGTRTKYEISNKGRCRNTEKLHWKTKGVLKPRFNRFNGYYTYTICSNEWDKYRPQYAHRLVLQHFAPTYDSSLHVNHKDGDKSNNIVSNLEWCTPFENMRHASKLELIGKPILQYDLKGNFIRRFSSATDAETELGYKQRTISAILSSNLPNSQSHGYQWRFEANDREVIDIVDDHKAHKRGVVQLDLDGNFIEYFHKATLSYDKLGTVDNGAVSQVCKGNRNTYMGSKWVYAKDYYKNYKD